MTASTDQSLSGMQEPHRSPEIPLQNQGDAHSAPPDALGWAETIERESSAGSESGSPAYSAAPQETTPPEMAQDLESDQRYLTVLTLMQHGAWPDIVFLLKDLQVDYPREAVLDGLLNEAQLKAEIVTRWEDKIKGRRLTVAQERLLRRMLPFAIMVGLFLCGLVFYQSLIAPSRQVFAQARTNQALLEDAQKQFQNGNYQEAIALYDQVLATEPTSTSAHQGRLEVNRHLDLAAKYDMAMTVAAAGNHERAQTFLEAIYAESPQFRDVEAKLQQIQLTTEAQQLFDAAEASYAQHRWPAAIAQYEELRTIAGDYEADVIAAHLSEAYLRAAQELVAQQPTDTLGPEEIQNYFKQGMSADQAAAQAEIDLLDVYLRGEKLQQRGDLHEATDVWRPVYDERPRYLGGHLAEQMYDAYLALGSQEVQNRDLEEARSFYQQAMELQVSDRSEADTRLAELVAQEATPVPTPTSTPKPVAYVAPAPLPPTPVPVLPNQGWIAFRTNRNRGEEIYMMRADGTDQQPASREIASQFDAIHDDERWSPDGTRESYVHTPGNVDGTDIYIREGEGSGVTMLTDFPGHEYDPVWSPDGQWVAFVSNYTGNDEVWITRVDGTEIRQLTANAWEWDKHPSWSPDSSQVAFFSNRTGTRQIWTIKIDGFEEWNASYNGFDDWDPIWIK